MLISRKWWMLWWQWCKKMYILYILIIAIEWHHIAEGQTFSCYASAMKKKSNDSECLWQSLDWHGRVVELLLLKPSRNSHDSSMNSNHMPQLVKLFRLAIRVHLITERNACHWSRRLVSRSTTGLLILMSSLTWLGSRLLTLRGCPSLVCLV